MIIRLRNNTAPEAIESIRKRLDNVNTEYRHISDLNVFVVPKLNDASFLKNDPSIESITEIDTPYQLASRAFKAGTSFDVKGITVSNESFNVIAGPCSVESEEQIFETAKFLSGLGVKFIRGGAYKPRTSPYSFKGLGLEGLKMLRSAADKYDLRVVTEIMDLDLLDEVYEYADILQVGSRNMQNFYMLGELGKIRKPVLLKRGMHARVTEWLLAAEYILSGGNEQVILCERGIRSFDPMSRNVMDVGVIPLLRELSHLPVIADPSHGTGSTSRVIPVALASAAAGANGLMIEVHPNPSKALSDGQQTISFEQFSALVAQLRPLLDVLSKHTKSTGSHVLNLHSLS